MEHATADVGMDWSTDDIRDGSAGDLAADLSLDGLVRADVDPLAPPEDCESVFPPGSRLCRDDVFCPYEWSMCCHTNLCGPPGVDVAGCCNDTSCGHAILPFGLFSCIGAAHDDFLRVSDCSECPSEYAFCCDHFRTPLFCTHERPYAWFCRELGG